MKRRRPSSGLGTRGPLLALTGAVTLAIAITLPPPVVDAAALPGSYPLTAYQWQLCESKVQPPQNGQASPCTDAMVDLAYHDRRITTKEHQAWYRSKQAAADGRDATYSTPPDGTPSAYTTAGSPTAGLPTIGSSTPAAPSSTPAAPSTTSPQPTSSSSSSVAGSLNATGSPDYLAGLGLTSPFCGGPGLSATQTENCQHTGSPWSTYPVGNYQLDINTGSNGGGILSLDVNGFVTGLLQQFANLLWMFGLYVLKAVITLVELAFGLNLFGNPGAMSGISAALGNLYDNFDVPWFGALLAAIGLWGIWTGLVQRRHSYTIGATLASVVMIAVAMWVIARPADTVGAAYQAADAAALTLIAAPSQGTVGDPQQSFANAMGSLWSQMVRGPWCALDFTSIQFCDGPPEQAAVKLAAKDAYLDNGILLPELASAMSPSGGNCKNAGANASTCIQHYVQSRDPYPPPATRADLYLRYSPGGKPRSDLWTFYHGTDDAHVLIFDVGGGHTGKDPADVSIQGSDGWINRIGLLLLLGSGLLGALLMLVWIAVRLVLQTCMGLVLLVLAPVVLVFPAFGENGREMFAKWGKALLGAMIAKAFYAAILAAAVTGSSAIATLQGTGTSSFGVSFLLLAAFWWAIFLKRNEILALVQAGPRNALADPERGHVAARAMAGYTAVLGGRYALRQASEDRIGRRQGQALLEQADRQAVRHAAHDELSASEQTKASNEIEPARRELDERDALQQSARTTQAELDELDARARQRTRPKRLGAEEPLSTAQERHQRDGLIARQRQLQQELAENEPRYRRAEQILGRERHLGLGGEALSATEAERRIEQLRDGDRNPTSDENLRSYAGITAAEFAARSPEEQAALQRTITTQMAREQSLLAAVPSPERGGIEHAPLQPGESAARLALPRDVIADRREREQRQLEERLREREDQRGVTRGVLRRRAGRRNQAEKFVRREARDQAWAEREAQQAAARAQWRLDGERRRGTGRP
jgi:hypothetical protein